MNIFIRIVRKMSRALMYTTREKFYAEKRKALTNSDFSVISSDCFGGIACHNLGQRFNSPTVNLFFSHDGFLHFVNNLKEYLQAELVEVKDESVPYPVGTLTYGENTIRIDFMHYKTFDEAKEKWNARRTRVNFSNIYIIQTVPKNLTKEHVEKFNALPYKHKLLITHENDYDCTCMVTHKMFSDEDYKPGGILEYRSYFSKDRFMDDIDYISFFNDTL